MLIFVKIFIVILGLCYVKVCVFRYLIEFEKYFFYIKLIDIDIILSIVSERYM